MKNIHLLFGLFLVMTPLVALGDVGFAHTNHPVSLLVNAQGWAQQDLSIRGSSYSATGISLNGLRLKIPYSAHFNAELPLMGIGLSAPKVQQNILSFEIQPQNPRLQTSATLGTKEYYSANLSAFNSGVGGFLEWEKAQRIDYDANNLNRYGGGAQIQQSMNDWQLDLIGAGQKKEFGAQGYYGQPANLYAEQTTEDALLFFGATRGEFDDAYFRASAAWRQFDDEIIGLTPHKVRSRFGTVALEGRTMEIQNIALNLRADLEHEQVDGTTTGRRTRGAVLILPEARLNRWVVRAGFNSVFQTSESADFLPQAGLDWLATDNTTVYAAYSENILQPDYQTLNSNAQLQQQQTQNTELGLRQFASETLDWRVAAFHRRLENASDWIGGIATDIGTLKSTGLESEVGFYPSAHLELRAFYQWVHKDNNRTDGLYELDYPEHLINFSGQWRLAPKFLLFAIQTLRYQTENDARTSTQFGADATVGLHWFPRSTSNLQVSVMLRNLWDTSFQALPGLPPPGRTLATGITVIW